MSHSNTLAVSAQEALQAAETYGGLTATGNSAVVRFVSRQHALVTGWPAGEVKADDSGTLLLPGQGSSDETPPPARSMVGQPRAGIVLHRHITDINHFPGPESVRDFMRHGALPAEACPVSLWVQLTLPLFRKA